MRADGDVTEKLYVLWGVAEIATYIGRTERATHHLLDRRHLLQGKWGAAGWRAAMSLQPISPPSRRPPLLRSASMSRKRRSGDKLPAFTPLIHETMDSPAWRALSLAAKALYPAMKRKLGGNVGLNGRLAFSAREGAAYLGANKDTAARALLDLQAKGFLIAREVGSLGATGEGRASLYELTELGGGADGRPAAKFKKWDPVKDFEVAHGKGYGVRKSRTLSQIPDVPVANPGRFGAEELACPYQVARGKSNALSAEARWLALRVKRVRAMSPAMSERLAPVVCIPGTSGDAACCSTAASLR